jgi:lipopolysaccharide transport protein LptA
MKLFRLLLVIAALSVRAQTNPPAENFTTTNQILTAVSTNAPAKPLETHIFSDTFYADLKKRVGIYSGNVRVTDQEMKLACDVLTVKVSTNGGRADTLIAEGRVKIEAADDKGKPVHISSDKALYEYKVANGATNETITWTGNIFVKSDMFTGSSEQLVWDRINGSISGTNNAQTITTQKKSPTNAPPAKLGTKL